jgi:carboxyl-terminal processing protease
MQARFPRTLRIAGLILLLLPRPAAAELKCSELSGLMQQFLHHHVLHWADDDPELEKRTVDTYLRRNDPSRTLLTVAEEQAIATSMKGVFERIKAGDCGPLIELNHTLVRHQERTAKFVRAFVLSDDYKLDEKASLVLDPDKRGSPTTPEERDALLRSWAHFQIATYVANGTPLVEARHKLADRYDRRFRRLLETPQQEIFGEFLDSFAGSLDPHSSYLSQEVLEDFRIGMSLSLEGIGVALSEQDGYAVAERIIPGGAADRQKVLKAKDKIIAVAQEDGDFVDIIDMPLREAVALIRGKAGSKVKLTVLRDGESTQRFNVTVVRDKIDLEEQAASLRFEERDVGGRKLKLAVLDLPSFYGDADPSQRQSTKDVERLLRQATAEKADGLLLDLSRNGGGLLQHAVTVSGFFLRSGPIVAIENGNGERQIESDTDESVRFAGPVVVLTSRVSASASEILAGALKDYHRAVIVGDDHTFGKGTVQTVSTLPHDEGALKITTQLFFRPGGLSTQHDGVRADIVIPSLVASEDYGEKNQPYSIPPHKTSPFLMSNEANDDRPGSHWVPLEEDALSRLAARSKARVDASPEFQEIRAKLAEQAKHPPAIAVSEFLHEREEEREKEPAVEDPAKEPPRPEVTEALSVLADLVTTRSGTSAGVAANTGL